MFGFKFSRSKKRGKITVGCRVSGNIGELVMSTDPKPGSCRVRADGTGTVESADDNQKWKIRCDIDGLIRVKATTQLKLVDEFHGVPTDEPPVDNIVS